MTVFDQLEKVMCDNIIEHMANCNVILGAMKDMPRVTGIRGISDRFRAEVFETETIRTACSISGSYLATHSQGRRVGLQFKDGGLWYAYKIDNTSPEVEEGLSLMYLHLIGVAEESTALGYPHNYPSPYMKVYSLHRIVTGKLWR